MLNSAANAAPCVISSRLGALTAPCAPGGTTYLGTGPQIPNSARIPRLSERSLLPFRPPEQQRQGIPFPRPHSQPLAAAGITGG